MMLSVIKVSLAVVLGACQPAPTLPADATPAPDVTSSCDPFTTLPVPFRPVRIVSSGMVDVVTVGAVTTATIDATAGGIAAAADNPYIYLTLTTGAKLPLDDRGARIATSWDIALKRTSLRVNGGDSGHGRRALAVVPGASLAALTVAPTAGYTTDDFATAACMPQLLSGGEPRTAFGEWYAFDGQTITPKPELYVIARDDETHTALRIVTYYGDPADPTRGGYYQLEWKDL
ncbi:MAG: HmuY family protein [Proteobacteria bacterium]|nr:HmuY family protein [Pseudomonadota bacterium]